MIFSLKEVLTSLKEELGFLKVFNKGELTSAKGFVEQEHVVGTLYGGTQGLDFVEQDCGFASVGRDCGGFG